MSNVTAPAPAALVLSADDKSTRDAVTAVRSAVRNMGSWSRYVAAHGVTRATVKDHAAALAALAYPADEPVQKVDGTRTRYGKAVAAAGNGMRYALDQSAGADDTDTDTDDDKAPASKPLLTRAGESATLDQIITAWHAAQAAAV